MGASSCRAYRACLVPLCISGIISCSSDHHPASPVPTTTTPTPPTGGPLSVTLTASATAVHQTGPVTLDAAVTGSGAKKVEFYARHVDVDSLKLIGVDSIAPYGANAEITNLADAGKWEFSARAYGSDGGFAISNTSLVTVDLIDDGPLQAVFRESQSVITTAGHISFTVTANKLLSRVDVYEGSKVVASVTNPANPASVSVNVTSADNGPKGYVVKATDSQGNAVSSATLPVVVDIRWDIIRPVEGVRAWQDLQLVTDAASNVYVALSVNKGPQGSPDPDAVLLKLDANLSTQWMRTFGATTWENVQSLGIDNLGRIFVTVETTAPFDAIPNTKCSLLLYDAAGQLVRTQQIAGPSINAASCSATSDPQGNVVVSGWSWDSTDGHSFLAKYDRNGSLLWSRKFRSVPSGGLTSSVDNVTAVAIDALGGIYVAGSTNGAFTGVPDGDHRWNTFLLKFNTDGNLLWAREYGNVGESWALYSLAADPDGGVYLAGTVHNAWSDQATAGSPELYILWDALVRRVGSDGQTLWSRQVNGGGEESARAIAADPSAVYVIGWRENGDGLHNFPEPNQGPIDGFLMKLGRDGTVLSMRELASPGGASAVSAAVTSGGDLLVAAYIAGTTAANSPNFEIARHHESTLMNSRRSRR